MFLGSWIKLILFVYSDYTHIMDELTAEEYEKVLQYMEAASEEDFSAAVATLKNHDFNLQVLPSPSRSQSIANTNPTLTILRPILLPIQLRMRRL
jgi:hypothetical protein